VKAKKLRFGNGFRVIFGNERAQGAQMVIAPGKAEGDPHNRHQGADQWLYVVSGTGRALVNGRRVPLKPGVMLLIEHRDRHEIRNTGRSALKTLNYYAPPAYTAQGNVYLAIARREGEPRVVEECIARGSPDDVRRLIVLHALDLLRTSAPHHEPAGCQ